MGPRQTTLCVPLEVKPESCSRLSAILDAFREREDADPSGTGENFGRLATAIPTLHFMSMSVFATRDYDPMFVIEANFDGGTGPFWGQVEAAIGSDLRDMLRCCKRPMDSDGPLYDAVTSPGSRAAVVPYIEARTQSPSVFHHGNRGMDRARICAEASLFSDLTLLVDKDEGSTSFRKLTARQIHSQLRSTLLPAYPWLSEEAPARIPAMQRAGDLFRLLIFAVALLFALLLPGFLLSMLMPWRVLVPLVLIIAGVLAVAIYWNRKPLGNTGIKGTFRLLPFLSRSAPLIVGYLLVATLALVLIAVVGSYLLAALDLRPPLRPGEAAAAIWPALLVGLLSLIVTLPALLMWLRYLEQRDSAHDAPHPNEGVVREMVRREDWVAQNHMGSIVMIKPGVLRSIIIRVGHYALGLVLRVVATNGYLGSLRTVHFAHWAFLNNGSRLLFFSNFDHSWDSYLDDFIEKAHNGLTLAWGCGVGFPPTRFLIYDGASHGRRFKNWALASRAVSRFWYSAYPSLTVDQIERNNRIANGLRYATLSEREARTWILDL
jgi:hypothetical protein